MPMRKGITLVSFLVYLLIFSLIMVLSAQWFSSTYYTLVCAMSEGSSCMEWYTAHDVLVRDLRMAPTDRAHFKCIMPHCLVWASSVRGSDIGWEFSRSGKLKRYEGTYVPGKGAWKSHTRAIVARELKGGEFEVIAQNDSITAVQFSMQTGKMAIRNCVCLRGGA